MRCNRFSGNRIAISNDGLLAAADAGDNWFGCNAGLGTAPCDGIEGLVDTPAWLVLGLEVDNPNPAAGGTTMATADLTQSSNLGPAAACCPTAYL